jgi:Na+-transporting NADH:ubiquinone oxidoreductase subunit NqrA
VDAFVIIEIGHLFSKGFVIQERYLSISGSGVKNPTNFIVKAGQPIKNLLDDLVTDLDSDYRLISGGLLTGKKNSYVRLFI